MDASAQVADRISLTKNTGIYNPDSNPYNWNPYFEMFSAVDMEPIDEVLFWRAYSSVQGVTHSVSSYLCKGGGDLGYTRSLVDACLMKNGLPIYAPNSGYAGDVTIENVKKTEMTVYSYLWVLLVIVQGLIHMRHINILRYWSRPMIDARQVIRFVNS